MHATEYVCTRVVCCHINLFINIKNLSILDVSRMTFLTNCLCRATVFSFNHVVKSFESATKSGLQIAMWNKSIFMFWRCFVVGATALCEHTKARAKQYWTHKIMPRPNHPQKTSRLSRSVLICQQVHKDLFTYEMVPLFVTAECHNSAQIEGRIWRLPTLHTVLVLYTSYIFSCLAGKVYCVSSTEVLTLFYRKKKVFLKLFERWVAKTKYALSLKHSNKNLTILNRAIVLLFWVKAYLSVCNLK